MSETVPFELEVRFVRLISSDEVELPPYPAVAMQLKELLLDREEYSVQQLAAVIGADQVLAATVLRYVNSPALRALHEITSLKEAVTRLGSSDLLGLALAVGLGAQIRAGSLQELKRMVWHEAVFSAEICRQLAERRDLPPEDAFTCGLLHDFGKMVAISCLERIVAGQSTAPLLSRQKCLQVIETYHVDLGELVAQRWALPELVTEIIATHHAADIGRDAPMVQLVRASDEVVALLEAHPFVSPELLRPVSLLSGAADRASFARLLTRLPEIVQAYEPLSSSGAAMRRGRRATAGVAAVLEKPRTTMGSESPCPVKIPVLRVDQALDPGESVYLATYVTGSGLGMRGDAAIPERTLVRLLLQPDSEPLELWGNVMLCAAERPGYRIEVHLLALTPEANLKWREFLAGLRSEAPGPG